jgi:DNA-binding NarL/FixJ family response regulator
VIRVLIVDDHPAVRAGVAAVIRAEPGLVLVGSCSGVEEAVAASSRTDVTVAVVDYDLGDGDGLDLCMRFQRGGIRTLVYSAYNERALAAASQLAGAGGLLSKSAGGEELCEAIRRVARGTALFPRLDGEVLEACASRVDEDDLAILETMLDGHSRREAAEALRLDERELERRLERMVETLRPSTGPLRSVPGGARQAPYSAAFPFE